VTRKRFVLLSRISASEILLLLRTLPRIALFRTGAAHSDSRDEYLTFYPFLGLGHGRVKKSFRASFFGLFEKGSWPPASQVSFSSMASQPGAPSLSVNSQ
jgi:hypothetical protein